MAIRRRTSGPIIPSSEGAAGSCFILFRKEADYALYSPYILCLAAGSLNIDAFRHCISQDVPILKAFARALELAEDWSDEDDEKLDISKLRKSILGALKLHDSFVEEWGLDLIQECPVNPATLKYTEFVLATASGDVAELKAQGKLTTRFGRTKVAAYALGAITPCVRLHGFLGKELQAFADPNEGNHPYQKWIFNYSSEDFKDLVKQTEDLMDKLSLCFTGDELKINENVYQQGLKLLAEFFYAQPLAQPTVVPLTKDLHPARDRLMLFSDFDLTCTEIDSAAILAELAIFTAPKSHKPPKRRKSSPRASKSPPKSPEPEPPEPPRYYKSRRLPKLPRPPEPPESDDEIENQPEGQVRRMLSAEVKNAWGEISRDYTEQFEQCIESILPSQKVEFNYENLHTALQEVSDFEKRENSKVVESGLLKGLRLENIKRAGQGMIFQDGCISFFQRIIKDENLNASVHILSYCWCSDFVRAAFSSAAQGLEVVNIHANEFGFEESISTGEIIGKIESPIDKVEAFNHILQGCSDDKRKLTVFIGDSVGDLLCLLKADIGIVIGSSASLRTVGEHYGVSFVPLFPGLVKKQKECDEGSDCLWKGESGILYTVERWDEIHAFVLGF
ncbi:PALE GREEN 1, THIAMINE REQUIRING 2 [Hibiscus trionum]|uniref:PALE GREEN 1, THIAMINE REQUIRING 2 n=1 Tax=Hibiscus trionum TaxID=183268 RepID=A0A9W7I6B0_HIBTR|nr:PALE GREEN 1, THIAMINE REQUIRING 2 [Hibiscus trionum]